jgi:hypothetical protein
MSILLAENSMAEQFVYNIQCYMKGSKHLTLYVLCLMILACSDNLPTTAQTRYLLRVNASSACPDSGPGALFAREFVFELRLIDKADFWTFKPASGTPKSGPNSGDVVLVLSGKSGHVTGVLSGVGLDGGSRNVGFSDSTQSGAARVSSTNNLQERSISGSLNGSISTPEYRSFAECSAPDHQWQLTIR